MAKGFRTICTMADLYIVRTRLKFSLLLATVVLMLSALATWWFWKQLEFEADNQTFLFSATVTGALALGWIGLLVSHLVAKHVVTPGYTMSDRIDDLPWWALKVILVLLVIGAGWFMIARYSNDSSNAFDLLVGDQLEALEARVELRPELLTRIDTKTDQTLIQMAFRHDQPEAVALLLSLGASGAGLDARGRNPIIASLKNPRMLESLLEGGLDPDQPDSAGVPALHHAVALADVAALAALLNAGADADARDLLYRSALSVAIENDDLAIAKALIDAGADLNAFDQRGDTPLHEAVRRGVEAVRLLLERGAGPAIFNFIHMTPLHLAAMDGRDEVVAVFLERPGMTGLADETGQTPLDLAMKGGKYETARLLIDAGADVNRVLADGGTLTHKAILSRDYKAARFLIRSGADMNIPNAEKRTALDLLREKELIGLMEMVEERDHPAAPADAE